MINCGAPPCREHNFLRICRFDHDLICCFVVFDMMLIKDNCIQLVKLGNVVRCGPADFACFDNKHLAISTTPMALSLTMDFAPCSNALRFAALCVHFVLFTMGFTPSLQPHPRPNPVSGVRSQHVLHHITTSLQPHPRPNPISGVRSHRTKMH